MWLFINTYITSLYFYQRLGVNLIQNGVVRDNVHIIRAHSYKPFKVFWSFKFLSYVMYSSSTSKEIECKYKKKRYDVWKKRKIK